MEEYLEVYTNSLDGTESPIKSFIKRSNIISFLIQKDTYSYRYYLYVYCTDGHSFIVRKSKRTDCFKSEDEVKGFLADILKNNDKEESSLIHY